MTGLRPDGARSRFWAVYGLLHWNGDRRLGKRDDPAQRFRMGSHSVVAPPLSKSPNPRGERLCDVLPLNVIEHAVTHHAGVFGFIDQELDWVIASALERQASKPFSANSSGQ